MKFNRHHPHLINGAIQAQQVLLFGPDKTPLGTKSLKDSLFAARQLGLDLILIAPKATPPVCFIGNYGKFLYEHNKKDHHQKAARLKEIQLSANIFEHDLETKVRHAKEFAAEGHPVKVVLRLRGREKAHPEIGRRQMQHFLTLACGPGNHPIQNQGGTFLSFIKA
jgi:translation initiation factor IF-3